jgi:hypothetical protein
VHASISRLRAENPTWDQLKVCRASVGWDRPRRFEDEWRSLTSHDWNVPHDASPETIRQLHELLDREEAEIEALEPRYPRITPQSRGEAADQPGTILSPTVRLSA